MKFRKRICRIIRTASLFLILLGIWGVNVSVIGMRLNFNVYTFWGTIWRVENYFHMSLFAIMFGAAVMWLSAEFENE